MFEWFNENATLVTGEEEQQQGGVAQTGVSENIVFASATILILTSLTLILNKKKKQHFKNRVIK